MVNKHSTTVEESYQLADEMSSKMIDANEKECSTCCICLEPLAVGEHFCTELHKNIFREAANDCNTIETEINDQELLLLKPDENQVENKLHGKKIMNKDVCLTPCGHYFHYGCIRSWLYRKRECAQCRSILSLLDCRIIYKTKVTISNAEESQNLDMYIIRNLAITQNRD